MRLPRRLAEGQRAQLVDHLDELRARLMVAGAAIAVGSVAGWLVHGQILRLLEQPLPPEHRRLVTFGVSEPFMTSLKVSLFAGFMLALPVVLWQVWGFLAPAASRSIRRTLGGFTAAATVLLGAGLVFGYKLALPAAMSFLTNFDNNLYDVQLQASPYITFALTALLAVALVFEVPIVILGLVRVGVLSAATLRRRRRHGYFAMVCLAVALPGVDPVTTMVEALPLVLLFELSIHAAALMERSMARSAVADPS